CRYSPAEAERRIIAAAVSAFTFPQSKIGNRKSKCLALWCNGNTAPNAFGFIVGSARCAFPQTEQATRQRFALWCNGNTAPFGGVILGSNPSGAAIASRVARSA